MPEPIKKPVLPPIPKEVIDDLHNKIIQKFRLQPQQIIIDKKFLEEHTLVNHETYQVTIFLKQMVGHKFTNNMFINFKKPKDYEEQLKKYYDWISNSSNSANNQEGPRSKTRQVITIKNKKIVNVENVDINKLNSKS